MNFNIDFLANQMRRKNPHKKINVEHIKEFISIVSRIEKWNQKMSTISAFRKISVSRRPKVEHLIFVEQMIKRKLKQTFFNLKKYAFLNKKQVLKKDQLLNYPVALLQRFYSGKIQKNIFLGFSQLRKNKIFLKKIESTLDSINKIQRQYIRKMFQFQFIQSLKKISTKKIEYQKHVESFEYLFDCIRIRVIFQSFTHISIKTLQKNIGDLEKKRNGRRDTSRVATIKKNEVTNDLKRKINNIMGMINENQINNNRRKVNGIRQNGFKLLKINEQTRIVENSVDYLEYEVQKLEKQIQQKESFLETRSIQVMKLQQLKQIYQEIQFSEENTQKCVQKVVPKAELDKFKEKLNFLVRENAQLKHQINLYQKLSSAKKQSYTIADHENTFIKQVISSIIQHHLMDEKAIELMSFSQSIGDHAKQYKSEWRIIKSSSKR